MQVFDNCCSKRTLTCFLKQYLPIIILIIVCASILISTYLQVDATTEEDELVIVLPNGKVLGRTNITAENKLFYVFENIPYAEAPVGRLRFKAPRPAKNWSGILNSSRRVDCLNTKGQKESSPNFQSEDCLYINVYTPNIPQLNGTLLPVPVVVYVFGGKFWGGYVASGASDLYINEDVIFVSFNYRVGALGYFTTGDDVITGNFAHKDQGLAFKWVKTNIHLFGGNPNRITIMGHSSGAGDCAYHLLNPKSQGLFQAMILLSGTFLSPPMFKRNGRQITFEIASLLNETFKTNNNSKDLYEYLVTVEAGEIIDAEDLYYNISLRPWSLVLENGTTIFGASFEMPSPEAFLTEKMYVLLKQGKFLKIPLLVGMSSEEKISTLQDEDYLFNVTKILDDNLDLLVPADMRIDNSTERRKMGEKIRQIYTEGKPFHENLGKAVRFSSDNFISRPSIKHAEIHSKAADVYFFQFSYTGLLSSVKKVLYEDAGSAGHIDLYNYLFCVGLSCTTSCKCSQEDVSVRKRLTKMLTNFAKYHNPTPEPAEFFDNLTWPRVSTIKGDFLYLNFNHTLTIENHPKNDSYGKWNELYDSLGYDDLDTF